MVLVLQTCLPEYRYPFFTELQRRCPEFKLQCGGSYFSPSVKTYSDPVGFCIYLNNRFLWFRNLLWQSGGFGDAVKARVLIVEFNPRVLSTWALLIVRRIFGRPTLLWGHLWGHLGPVWISRKIRLGMMGLSDGMICYTETQAREISAILPHYRVSYASNSSVSAATCIPTDYPYYGECIVYVGRLIESKKPMFLLEAFFQALPILPMNCKLVIVGDGPLREALERRIVELGLECRVELLGHVGLDLDLRRIYSRAAVAVSPGYVGLSAVQCMSAGVPMLISRSEPHSPEIEACVENETCVFFETGDFGDFSQKLSDFFKPNSPWRVRRVSIAGFIARKYTIEGMARSFIDAASSVSRQLKEEGVASAALVWAQYGPYHLARLKALRAFKRDCAIVGVEIADKTQTYAWTRSEPAEASAVVTLARGRVVESISAVEIFRAARSAFRKHDCRVVLIPSYWPISSLALILAARSLGAKVVMMNETHANTAKARGVFRFIKSIIVRQFDAAIVGGNPHRDYFCELGLRSERITLGYDAVDNVYFSARALCARGDSIQVRRKHSLPLRFFLSVGRMEWKKNLELLVEAYALVKLRLGTACPQLVFVGSGRSEAALHERCLHHRLSLYQCRKSTVARAASDADVLFLGFRQVDELPEIYALAEAFVMPSREEEWGLVVNEAMACGLPVVVSRAAGCAPDLVHHGENGFQFDPFDAGQLADQLETVARDPALRQKMGAASQRIIGDWGCERFAAGASEAIDIALGQKAAS